MHTDLIADSGRASSATDCSVEVVETESGVPEIKGHLAKGFSK